MTERHTLTLPYGSISVDRVEGQIGLHTTYMPDQGDVKRTSFTLQPEHVAWLAAVLGNMGERECLDCSS